ncbi:hypothetical protein BH23CHL2_BH23CHL2_34660 [soil metagenome]
MVDAEARSRSLARQDIPEIVVVNCATALTARPATIFEVRLIAGDTADAVLWLSIARGNHRIIEIRARAGGSAGYTPAAPAFIRDPLQVHLSGADAVGTVSYR